MLTSLGGAYGDGVAGGPHVVLVEYPHLDEDLGVGRQVDELKLHVPHVTLGAGPRVLLGLIYDQVLLTHHLRTLLLLPELDLGG